MPNEIVRGSRRESTPPVARPRLRWQADLVNAGSTPGASTGRQTAAASPPHSTVSARVRGVNRVQVAKHRRRAQHAVPLRGRGVGDDFDAEFAGAGAVEFGEEYGLPAAEREAAIFDPDGFGGADDCGFYVRIGVAFGMLVVAAARDEAVERGFDITRYRGIVAFVNENASGGVRHVQMTDAVKAAGFADDGFNFGGDVF